MKYNDGWFSWLKHGAKYYIEQAHRNVYSIYLTNTSELVFMDDWHIDSKNIEGKKPHNANAQNIDYLRNIVVPYYIQRHYDGIISEWFDMWEAKKWQNVWEYPPNQTLIWKANRLFRKWIPGNHSLSLLNNQPTQIVGTKQALTIHVYAPNGRLICIAQHGNSADFWNKGTTITTLVKVGVRYIWVPLQWAGAQSGSKKFSASNSPRKADEVERHYIRYANEYVKALYPKDEKPIIMKIGHTHKPDLYQSDRCIYANGGAWCYPNMFGGEAIELNAKRIRLVSWHGDSKPNVEKKEIELA